MVKLTHLLPPGTKQQPRQDQRQEGLVTRSVVMRRRHAERLFYNIGRRFVASVMTVGSTLVLGVTGGENSDAAQQ